MFLFCFVLWQSKHIMSFNAKYFLYIYIKYMVSKHIFDNI